MLDQANTERDIRILLVGDPGVGKTSLIYALVNEEFVDYLPPRMSEITMPADTTLQQIPSTITDYSQQEQRLDKLTDEINRANVVCLVYSADDDDSLAHVSSFWLPFIRECQHERHSHDHLSYKPVILIRNKIDLNSSEGPLGEVLEIIGAHPEVEAYIDVSAKLLQNVSELFVTAQRTILYPLTPLYDIHWRSLTRKCRRALTRVFIECDVDGDELLSDHEINQLQTKCFGSPLQSETLNDVKAIIQQSITEGVVNDCITLKGFLFLHLLSIERDKHDITWTVLRHHGYGDNLRKMGIVNDDYDDDVDSLASTTSSLNYDHSTLSSITAAQLSSRVPFTKPTTDVVSHSWIRSHVDGCFTLRNILLTTGFSLAAANIIGLILFRFFALK